MTILSLIAKLLASLYVRESRTDRQTWYYNFWELFESPTLTGGRVVVSVEIDRGGRSVCPAAENAVTLPAPLYEGAD